MPSILQYSMYVLGDGVGFTIEVKNSSGQIEKLFSKYIDPKHNPDERRWMDGEIV